MVKKIELNKQKFWNFSRRKFLSDLLKIIFEVTYSVGIIGLIVSSKLSPDKKISIVDFILPIIILIFSLIAGLIITPSKEENLE